MVLIYCHSIILIDVNLQQNDRPVEELVKYLLDVATGMHYISEKGLVHRVSFPYASCCLVSRPSIIIGIVRTFCIVLVIVRTYCQLVIHFNTI